MLAIKSVGGLLRSSFPKATPTLQSFRTIVIPESHKELSSEVEPYLLRNQQPLFSQFVNLLMRNGEKQKAQRVMSEALTTIHTKTKSNPYDVLEQAINKTRPLVQVKSFKKGGKNAMVPFALTERQSKRRGILWIIESANSEANCREEKRLGKRIGKEIINTIAGKSGSLAKKTQVHKLALDNRSNANVMVGQ